MKFELEKLELKTDWSSMSALDFANKDLERFNRHIALRIENRKLMSQWNAINAPRKHSNKQDISKGHNEIEKALEAILNTSKDGGKYGQ